MRRGRGALQAEDANGKEGQSNPHVMCRQLVRQSGGCMPLGVSKTDDSPSPCRSLEWRGGLSTPSGRKMKPVEPSKETTGTTKAPVSSKPSSRNTKQSAKLDGTDHSPPHSPNVDTPHLIPVIRLDLTAPYPHETRPTHTSAFRLPAQTLTTPTAAEPTGGAGGAAEGSVNPEGNAEEGDVMSKAEVLMTMQVADADRSDTHAAITCSLPEMPQPEDQTSATGQLVLETSEEPNALVAQIMKPIGTAVDDCVDVKQPSESHTIACLTNADQTKAEQTKEAQLTTCLIVGATTVSALDNVTNE